MSSMIGAGFRVLISKPGLPEVESVSRCCELVKIQHEKMNMNFIYTYFFMKTWED